MRTDILSFEKKNNCYNFEKKTRRDIRTRVDRRSIGLY